MAWTPPEHDPAVELREHLPVPEWGKAIAAICARHGVVPDGAAPCATGSDVVWAVGQRVVKMTAPLWRDEIEAEVRLLGRVAGRLSVATPAVVAHGELEGWPYVVMTRVPGVAAGSVWAELEHATRVRFAAALGELVCELHALDPREDGADWPAFWERCRADVARRHARPGVPEELLAQIEPFLERVGALDDRGRALLHTELLDEHVLVDADVDAARPCALIDFADGCVGPPAYEYAAPVEFLFRGEPGLLAAFLAGAGATRLDEEGSERMLAWALCHRFGALLRMLRAVAPARPGTLAELARTLYRP